MVALKAAEIMREYSFHNQAIEIKDDHSPVTIADKKINTLLIEEIRSRFPDHGVLGEEESWQPERKYVWVCDPIDGTVQFIQHIPLSMFSLALVVEGEVQVAVAHNPWVKDMYSAIKNLGTWRNEESIHVSKRTWGSGIRLAGASGNWISTEPVDQKVIRESLKVQNIYVTNIPGAVFKGCLIAEGSLDGRFFMHDGAHDVAAIKLLIEEAGGKVTDLQGNDQRYDRKVNGAILSNGIIHEELLGLIGERGGNADSRN